MSLESAAHPAASVEAAAMQAFMASVSSSELSVTRAASEQLTELFAQADDDFEAIRIFVSGGGCSGMTYGMTYTSERNEYDKVLDGDGFKIYIDAIAHAYLAGVEIDYETRDTGATFVFNNVFQVTGGSGTCGGCGAAGGCGG